tara:strand:- start:57 stop:632 length:576 start_codon:yes stop_codon:yes gene_type:complete
MKYISFIIFFWSFFISFAQSHNEASTQLLIVQGSDSTCIEDSTNSIDLKTEPFSFVFHSINTDAVFLNCSFDSTSYHKVIRADYDSLVCFDPTDTFVEEEKNYNRDIIISKEFDDGYHCLFGINDDERFIRFDKVFVESSNDWIGVRTVESVYVKPGKGLTSLDYLKEKSLYIVFSPGLEKFGYALRINFE